MSPVSDYANRHEKDARLEGYTFADHNVELRIGLPNGTYYVTVMCYNNNKHRDYGHYSSCYNNNKHRDYGPFAVKANEKIAISDIQVPYVKVVRKSFACRVQNHLLKLEFVPYAGKAFMINTLEIKGKNHVKPIPLFSTAPLTILPKRQDLLRHSPLAPEKALRHYCDWLLSRQQNNGFIGDRWSGSFVPWYTISTPTRALLAGYDILGDKKYLEASRKALDIFVAEQLPNGAWTDVFRNQPTKCLSKVERNDLMANARQPMSDIGSPVCALAVASQYVAPFHKKRYIRAVRNFCSNWASKYQYASGAFSDGLWKGFPGIYSCATAIEAAAFALAYKITDNPCYMNVAMKAIRFLLRDWRDDGLMLGRAPHWFVRDGKPFIMEKLYFGDSWYYDDGFITAYHHSSDQKFRKKVNHALDRRVWGRNGLIAAKEENVWWPLQDIWNNAKSVGLVQTLLHAHRHGTTNDKLAGAIEDMRRFLCSPRYAASVGVTPNDDERPARLYCLNTWSGMSMESTGFAGMTLAEMIKPGILYLK